jgi:prepilin-type N-terminal cleavage/methylation domain-containing protein
MINRRGFTLVELIVVITVVAILATISTLSYAAIQAQGRDTKRESNATVISEALEKYYDANGEYPGCPALTGNSITVRANTLKGIDESALLTPKATSGATNTIKCVDLVSTTGEDFYSYTGDSSIECLSGVACTKWTLKYIDEKSNTIAQIQSRRTAPGSGLSDPTGVTIAASMVGTSARGNGTASCNGSSTLEQQIRYRSTNTSTVGTWSNWTDGGQQDVPANQGYQYTFQQRARCTASLTSSNWISSATAATVRPIAAAPSPVTVTVAPGSPTLTFNRTDATCPAGTTGRYQYKYLADFPYESPWYGPSMAGSYSWSAASEGFEYEMQIQAQCYTTYSTSPWSSSNGASYIRSVATPVGAANFAMNVSGDRTTYTYNWTAPSCGPSARAEYRYNSYIGGGGELYWVQTGTNGWVYGNGGWSAQGFWTSSHVVTIVNGTLPGGVPLQHRTQYICVNSTTGRTSSWGPAVSSQMFNT